MDEPIGHDSVLGGRVCRDPCRLEVLDFQADTERPLIMSVILEI